MFRRWLKVAAVWAVCAVLMVVFAWAGDAYSPAARAAGAGQEEQVLALIFGGLTVLGLLVLIWMALAGTFKWMLFGSSRAKSR